MLELRRGGHRDLEKYYGLMEIDYDSAELLSKFSIHKGMMSGDLELMIAYDTETQMEIGYALSFVKGLYGYVLLKYFAIMPWLRGKGLGVQTMRLIHKRYAEAQGILAEVTDFPDEDKDHQRKQMKFLNRFGYEERESDYRISGTRAHLMLKPIKSDADITSVEHRIVRELYSRVLSPTAYEKMIDIRKITKE